MKKTYLFEAAKNVVIPAGMRKCNVIPGEVTITRKNFDSFYNQMDDVAQTAEDETNGNSDDIVNFFRQILAEAYMPGVCLTLSTFVFTNRSLYYKKNNNMRLYECYKKLVTLYVDYAHKVIKSEFLPTFDNWLSLLQ